MTPSGRTHVRALISALTHLGPQVETAERWGTELAALLAEGARLLTAGNGGSAAHAQHLTAELVGRYRDDRAPFSAIALHADTSSLTAIGNDYGYDEVFARQVRAHGRVGDVLLLISTSGTSPNLLRAADQGRQSGLHVWALTGPRPNPLADTSDEAISVDAPSAACSQEVHQVIVHLLCAAADTALGTDSANRTDSTGTKLGTDSTGDAKSTTGTYGVNAALSIDGAEPHPARTV